MKECGSASKIDLAFPRCGIVSPSSRCAAVVTDASSRPDAIGHRRSQVIAERRRRRIFREARQRRRCFPERRMLQALQTMDCPPTDSHISAPRDIEVDLRNHSRQPREWYNSRRANVDLSRCRRRGFKNYLSCEAVRALYSASKPRFASFPPLP